MALVGRPPPTSSRFDRDFLLTLVTLYWVTNTISTANRDYIDNRDAGTAALAEYVTVRTAIANFHHNRVSEGVLPREWAQRLYAVERFTDMPRGGHFAAAEAPDLLGRRHHGLLRALARHAGDLPAAVDLAQRDLGSAGREPRARVVARGGDRVDRQRLGLASTRPR